MQKKLDLYATMIALVVSLCFACNSNSNNNAQKEEKKSGLLLRAERLLALATEKPAKQREYTERWFVAKWNTPGYYSGNDEFNMILYDFAVITGRSEGEFVYFLDSVKLSELDTMVVLETKCYKRSLTQDIRQTAFWIAQIQLEEQSSLDEFLSFIGDATLEAEYKREITECTGKDWKTKIINYTAQVVPGTPKNWDAWKYPGYSEDKYPSLLELLAEYL